MTSDLKLGKTVYAKIYTRFGKSRCLITNKSGDKSRLTLDDLVGEKFKGSCIIKLYQAFVGSNSCRLWHGSRGVILKNQKNLNKLLVFEALYL